MPVPYRKWYAGRMKVLGIDPGYGRCGVAVVEKNGGGREVLLYSDCIETPAKMPFGDRLVRVAQECARLMRVHAPDSLALEKLYFQKNQKTAMRVAEVRGALLHAAAEAGLSLFEYTPRGGKKPPAGAGSGSQNASA